jgi:septum formation protein
VYKRQDDPSTYVQELAQLKARSVAQNLKTGLVIGADTAVVIQNDILGKPLNAEEARLMLRRLSGATHEVYTGVALIQIGGDTLCQVERTVVEFLPLEDWEIEDYIATGSPFDKAGG